MNIFITMWKKRGLKIALATSIFAVSILGSAQNADAYGLFNGTVDATPYPISYHPSSSIPNYTNGFAIYGTTTASLPDGAYDLTGGNCTFAANTSGTGAYSATPASLQACGGVALTGTYYIYFFGNRVSGNTYDTIQGYDVLVGGNVLNNFNTRIVSTVPVSGDTIATSSTAIIGADVYVNEADFNSSQFVEISFFRNQDQQGSFSSPDLITTTIDFPPLTSSGPSSVSTTTSILRSGTYTMTTRIKQTSLAGNILNFFGFGVLANNSLIASTTEFIAVAPTAYDNFISSTTQAFANFVASSTISTSACTSFSGFNFQDCLSLMFTWQTQPMNQEFANLNTNLFAYAPWGYVTRTLSILSSTGSTTMPAISYTFPSDFPAPILAGVNISFDPWNYFNFYKNFKSSGGSPQDVWQIIQPIFTAFCWLWTAWLIFRDMLKIEHGTGGGRRGNTRET